MGLFHGLQPCREIAPHRLPDLHGQDRRPGDRAAFEVHNATLDRSVIPDETDRQVERIDRFFGIERLGPGAANPESLSRRHKVRDLPAIPRARQRLEVPLGGRETESALRVGDRADDRRHRAVIELIGQTQLRAGDGLSLGVEDAPSIFESFALGFDFRPGGSALGDRALRRVRRGLPDTPPRGSSVVV